MHCSDAVSSAAHSTCLVATDELEGELKMQPGEGEMLDRDGDQVRRDTALSEAFWWLAWSSS